MSIFYLQIIHPFELLKFRTFDWWYFGPERRLFPYFKGGCHFWKGYKGNLCWWVGALIFREAYIQRAYSRDFTKGIRIKVYIFLLISIWLSEHKYSLCLKKVITWTCKTLWAFYVVIYIILRGVMSLRIDQQICVSVLISSIVCIKLLFCTWRDNSFQLQVWRKTCKHQST